MTVADQAGMPGVVASPSTAEVDPARAERAWCSGPWSVALASLVWLSATLGWRPLMQPDEGRYIGVAWEMLWSGDWVVPMLNGLPFFHKPPLFYWISAASLQVFGIHDFAGRLPSVLGAVGAVVMLFVFARRWSGLGMARASALVLVTQPGWFIGAQFANLDMLVAGCMSMTILALAHAALLLQQASPSSSVRRWLVAAWLFAALGVLAKGLIGFVLPGLVIVAWLAWQRSLRLLPRLFWWPGPLVFVMVGGPWFVVMQQRFPEFFDYFVVEQHFRRFTGHDFNNVHPFWFYVPVIALMILPWAPWLLRTWHRRGAPASSAEHRGELPAPGVIASRRLMWTWAAVILVFFSLPASKLAGYIFPVLPPLAWLVADAAFGRGRRLPRAWRTSAIGGAVLCVAAVAILARVQPPGSGAIASVLSAQRQPRQPIVLLDRFPYDLGLKVPLKAPLPVVGNWSDPDLALHDNWRKELLDAGRFAPERASHVLIDRTKMKALVCGTSVSWVVGETRAATRFPWLAGQSPVATSGDLALWRLDASTLPLLCP